MKGPDPGFLHVISGDHIPATSTIKWVRHHPNSRERLRCTLKPFLTRDCSKLRTVQTPTFGLAIRLKPVAIPCTHLRQLYSHLFAPGQPRVLRLHTTSTPLGDRDPSPSPNERPARRPAWTRMDAQFSLDPLSIPSWCLPSISPQMNASILGDHDMGAQDGRAL